MKGSTNNVPDRFSPRFHRNLPFLGSLRLNRSYLLQTKQLMYPVAFDRRCPVEFYFLEVNYRQIQRGPATRYLYIIKLIE